MDDDNPVKAAAAVASPSPENPVATSGRANARVGAVRIASRHRIFWMAWHGCTGLLVVSVLLAAYSAVWEYSTRRYLKGFSDAIVPAESTPVDKIQAILNWMSRGPARLDTGPPESRQDRNPADTLNYASLLQVCGTATNAFINLADSAGLPSRRLLLLDSHRSATHVVAEVLVNRRWIIVDPAFRTLPRGPGGTLLTRNDLADPAVFAAATRNIPNYDPAYNYERTVHVRLARVPYVGNPLRKILNTLVPGWENSTELSLLLERESLASLVFAIFLLVFAALLRVGLRCYAAARLGIRPLHLHRRMARACYAFLEMAG
jgi:Transglutaminase-like superfamily